ncbi:MAG: hypothetical protein V2G42_00415 [bacterium JZ-2024 1]
MGTRNLWIFTIALVYFGMFLPRSVSFSGGGWNEKSRLALTRAIVEQGTLKIDAFEHSTGDKAFYQGHYYSDKAPGLSFAAVPVYAFIYTIERWTGSRRWQAIDPPDLTNWWLITLFTVSVPCAVGAVLLDRLCMQWIGSPDRALFATLAYIFASPISFYASIFVGHAVAASLAIAVFYVLLSQGQPNNRQFFVAGLLSGVGVLTEYPFALFAVLMLLFVLLKWRKLSGGVMFAAGWLPGILLLAGYLAIVFGNPFRMGYTLEVRPEFAEIHRAPLLGFSLPSLSAFLGITISPFRGIFFFCPILILGVLGLFNRNQVAQTNCPRGLLWILTLGFLIANAAYPVWDGGDLPLARHAILSIPWMLVGIAFWNTGFHSVPARWIFLISAFNVFVMRLNLYHSTGYYNPLFDLALPNLVSSEALPTLGARFSLPGITAVVPHVLISTFFVTAARRHIR